MKWLLRLAIFTVFFFLPGSVQAQTCDGGYLCCSAAVSVECPCGRDGSGNCKCEYVQLCSGTIYSRGCSNTLNCSPYDLPNPCDGGAVMSSGCYAPGACPTGTNYCGGNLQSCCPNTQTCNTWIVQGACPGSDPDPGQPGVSPPSCSPRQNGWTGGRPNFSFVEQPAGGPNWDPAMQLYFLRTDNTFGQVSVQWAALQSEIDAIEYRFVPFDQENNTLLADGSGATGCNHIRARCGTLSGTASSLSFRPRESRYYRLRLRFRHQCQGVWSSWREQVVRIDGQVTGRVFVLSSADSAVPSGNNGTCSSVGGIAYPNFPGVVSLQSGEASFTDTTLHANLARYRGWLPYLNPGAVTVRLHDVPAGYTVVCPAGGAYTSENSSISAPFLTNGMTGSVDEANFYLCPVGALPQPGPENITFPQEGSSVTPDLQSGNFHVPLTFSKPLNTQVEYRVYPRNQPPPLSGTLVGSLGETTTAASFIPIESEYVVEIKFTQTACGRTMESDWSLPRSFQVVGHVSGTVYADPSFVAGSAVSYCPLEVTLQPHSGGTIFSGNGTMQRIGSEYMVTVPWGTSSGLVGFAPNSSGDICSCPAGCVFGSVPLMTENVNFFVSQHHESWWQVVSGSVWAGGDSGVVLRSSIPPTCQPPGCQPYLITGSSGYVLTGQSPEGNQRGEIDLSAESGLQFLSLDQARKNIWAQTRLDPLREGYEVFLRRYNFPRLDRRQDDFDGVDGRPLGNAAGKPTHRPRNFLSEVNAEKPGAYWSSQDLSITEPWVIAPDEVRVVFVEGDVIIHAPISVSPGGFLAVLAKGDITFTAELGHDNPSQTDSIVAGFYLADGFLRLPSRGAASGGDKKFVGAGTFVGWGGVLMERSYSGQITDLMNNFYPSEVFVYRPDFLISAPREFRRPEYTWQEIAP